MITHEPFFARCRWLLYSLYIEPRLLQQRDNSSDGCLLLSQAYAFYAHLLTVSSRSSCEPLSSESTLQYSQEINVSAPRALLQGLDFPIHGIDHMGNRRVLNRRFLPILGIRLSFLFHLFLRRVGQWFSPDRFLVPIGLHPCALMSKARRCQYIRQCPVTRICRWGVH